MSTELVALQNELMISKLQHEVTELRYKLQRTQAEKASRLEDSLFAPALYDHYQKVAVTLSKSGVIPNAYKGKPEDIFVAMAMGYQLGFPVEQSLQDIAVVNGRPCLWGDGLLSLALNHPECESIEETPILNDKSNVVGYRCVVIRRGHPPHCKQFTLQDASVAGLLKKGGVWNSYPERMLQMRARSLAIRDKFADALRGLRIAEVEEEDSRVIEAESRVIEAENVTVTQYTTQSTQTEKLNAILEAQEHVASEINEEIGRDDVMINDEQMAKICVLINEKGFTEDRMEKALAYYKVDELNKLTDAQAKSFIAQLRRL